jgi:hypothetical protein
VGESCLYERFGRAAIIVPTSLLHVTAPRALEGAQVRAPGILNWYEKSTRGARRAETRALQKAAMSTTSCDRFDLLPHSVSRQDKPFIRQRIRLPYRAGTASFGACGGVCCIF